MLTYQDMCDIRQPRELYFGGIRIQQPWTALFVLEDILNKEPDIQTIIELGTGNGALSIFFGLHMIQHKGCVYTYDTTEPASSFFELKQRFPIVYEQRDIIEHSDKIRKNMIDRRCLVFCDAGDRDLRVPEFRLYTSFLKPNDIIMAHDYKNSIQAEDVVDLPLKPYRQDDFDALDCYIFSRIH